MQRPPARAARPRAAVALALLLLAGASACGEGGGDPAPGPQPPSNLVYSANPATYVKDVAIAANVPSSQGGAVSGYSVSPPLPSGLSLDAATGVITGTPTVAASRNTHVVTASNPGGATRALLDVTVLPIAPPVNLRYPVDPATYVRGTAVAANVPASDGGAVAGYAVSPSLPAGLAFSTATGAITGTPEAAAPRGTFEVTATNAGGSTSVTLAITVLASPVAAIAVTPATADILAGGAAVALTARATLADSSTVDVTREAAWSTSSVAQVAVNAGSATSPGSARVGVSATVTASLLGQQGTSTLRVVRGAPIGPVLGGDPLATEQWYLANTGQTAFSDAAGTPGEDLRLTASYALGLSGKGVKIGVVDSGMEIGHPDLAANVVPGSWNFTTGNDDPSPPATSTGGDHGTSVSGIVGMVYGNGIGGMGIAPRAGLNGYNWLVTGNQSLQNLAWSLGQSSSSPASSDVWIFNQSFGTDVPFPVPVGAGEVAIYESGVRTLRGGKGAIYVQAAGNGFRYLGADTQATNCDAARALGVTCENVNMEARRALPYEIAVGALNASGRKSSYSSAGSAIWVAAPGGEYGRNVSVYDPPPPAPTPPAYVYWPAMVTVDRTGCVNGYAWTGATTSTFNQGAVPNTSCDYTSTFNGTSSATPAAVGAIALLLDARPDLTWRDVKHVLAMTARKVDPSNPGVSVALSDGTYVAELPWTTNAAGMAFHNWYGFGAIDVDQAVDFAKTYVADSLGTFRTSDWSASGAAMGLAIPDERAAGASSTIVLAADLVVEQVQIEVDVTHARPGDLGIELTGPSGSRSILLNIRNGFEPATGLSMTLASNLFYGERSAGSWTVKVVDGMAGVTGTLDQWRIRIHGH